jgi:hypothetical protein
MGAVGCLIVGLESGDHCCQALEDREQYPEHWKSMLCQPQLCQCQLLLGYILCKYYGLLLIMQEDFRDP